MTKAEANKVKACREKQIDDLMALVMSGPKTPECKAYCDELKAKKKALKADTKEEVSPLILAAL